MRSVLITGANGLIGRHLCRKFCSHGWSVRAMVREDDSALIPNPNLSIYKSNLPFEADETAFQNLNAIIHCAYSTHETDPSRDHNINIKGTLLIRNFAKIYSADSFVFLSSLAATKHAKTSYGQGKFEIEEMLDKDKDLIIRPGLVIAPDAGLFGKMLKFINASLFAPNFIDVRRKFYIVDIDDLCEILYSLVDVTTHGTHVIACPSPVTLRHIQECIVKRINKKRIFVPIPATCCILFAKTLETLGIRLPFNSDQISSLKTMDHESLCSGENLIEYAYKSAEESILNMKI